MAGNKVSGDKAYLAAINSIRNTDIRSKFTYFMGENLHDVHDSVVQRVVSIESVKGYTPEGIVNSVFENFFDAAVGLSYNEEEDKRLSALNEAMYEEAYDIAYDEYVTCENPEIDLTSLTMFKEDTTVAEAFDIISKNVKDDSFLNRMK